MQPNKCCHISWIVVSYKKEKQKKLTSVITFDEKLNIIMQHAGNSSHTVNYGLNYERRTGVDYVFIIKLIK